MVQAHEALLDRGTVIGEMKKNGVTHALGLPDSETISLHEAMKADPSFTLIAVSREGLAFPAVAGLFITGKTPIIMMQNTGLLESGDSLRGWALGLNIPVVLVVGYRGWTRHGITRDTAAIYTERFLNAFGINYYMVESNADAPRISVAFEEARRMKRPVAVLITDDYMASNFGYDR